jgi:DNA-binding CsgD family transcriptional regulator
MNSEPTLDESDVRAIVRAIAEVHDVPGDHTAKIRALMSSLASLIDADCWAWGMALQMAPNKPSVHISLLHSGFDEHHYAMFTKAYNHPGMTAVHASFARDLQEQQCHLTRTRIQIIPDEIYQNSEYHECWLRAGIEDVIMSLCPLDGEAFSIVGIYRKPGRPRFSARDNRVAHIILAGVPWLHAACWPERDLHVAKRLTPRQRMTLDLLIQGYSRDKIAAHLEISPHTANEYVKAVYRYFDVHSQPSLIARLQNGDGKDVSLQ